MMKVSARLLSITLVAPAALLAGAYQSVAADDLASFAVLAGSTVTNTGSSIISGNVGVSPGNAITGFPPGLVIDGVIYTSGGVVEQAQSDLTTQYTTLNGQPPTNNLTSTNLGGLTLTSGVYKFDDSAQLTGSLTLDAQGNPNSRFVFVIGSTLTTAAASQINLINSAQGGNVYFVVGSSAVLGTDTAFAGQILALTSITLDTGATINCGAALARNGAVTLDSNTISICVLDTATIGSILGSTATGGNQQSVGSAIDSYMSGGETLPVAFQNLTSFLSPQELNDALSQLSGEIATSAAPVATQATTSFLSHIFNELGDSKEGSGSGPRDEILGPEGTAPATVKTLGYGPDDQNRASGAGLSAFDRTATPDPRRWNAWASAYGDRTTADGSISDGTHDTTATSSGFAGGLDYRVTPSFRLGFALSSGRSNFSLSDNLGDGDSDITQAAVYARKDFDAAYIAAALSASYDHVRTDRELTFDGGDRLTSSFSAYGIAGRIETGYRFTLPEIRLLPGDGGLTPFASIQVQTFHSPSYGENSDAGGSPYALNYTANTTTALHSELGVKLDRDMMVSDSGRLILRSRIAWAHDSSQDPTLQASFQALPGNSFTVNGAQYGSDALLVSAGAEFTMTTGLSIGALLDSRFAQGSRSYSGTARIAYAW